MVTFHGTPFLHNFATLRLIFCPVQRLRLLAASTSFVALLLITNSATAVALEATEIELPQLSLNVVNPTLQLASARDRTSLDHLGCSCGVCTQRNALVSNNI